MARWARSRGGGGEGRGRAPQPFRGSSPSPALARPLARARALPSGSSSLPGPAGRCAFAPVPRYLGRRRRSRPMPISRFPSAPPTPGWLCQPLCPGCQGQRPALCNTRSRTPSAKLYNLKWTAFCKKLRSLQT